MIGEPTGFWNWWIIVLTVVNLLACWWLIRWTTKARPGDVGVGEAMHHSWDGLHELNNPLPRWWLWMFYITLVFSVIYFALYPGLGNFKGLLNWSQVGQYDAEVQKAEEKYGPLYKQYASLDAGALAKDDKAMAMGQRLYLNYCAQCHGADAGGNTGFPSLKDGDWLWGGDFGAIKTSILEGRAGVMPAYDGVLDTATTEQVVEYVLTLSGREADASAAAAGKATYEAQCAACHMPDGTGNVAMGAPNLTDKIWLYGSTKASITESIVKGRAGQMPAYRDFLGEDRVHVLSAYVANLSAK